MTYLSNSVGSIELNSASDILLYAPNTVNVGPAQVRGSNIGNALGNYTPLRFYYEPPTASGQYAQIEIEAHPADAGVRYNLKYGVDLNAASAFLICEWPGYIVVPITIYGQNVTMDAGENAYVKAGSGYVHRRIS